MNASIGLIAPNEALYRSIPEFLKYAAGYGFYIEFTGFTGPYSGMFNTQSEMVNHWERLISACEGATNVFLELVNEADNTPNLGIPMERLRRPFGILSSRGSMRADIFPTAVWDYASYHSNDLNEWQRKVGHNTMEVADRFNVPATGNENTRMPDKDASALHACDAARAAALLCAGSCFHSVHGKNSQLWEGQELVCAEAWARGAREVDLFFQRGAYHHRFDLEAPGVIRAYDRTRDGREFTVLIRA